MIGLFPEFYETIVPLEGFEAEFVRLAEFAIGSLGVRHTTSDDGHQLQARQEFVDVAPDAEFAGAFFDSVLAADLAWAAMLAQNSGRVRPERSAVIGLYLSLNNSAVEEREADGEDVPFELILRRVDVILEALRSVQTAAGYRGAAYLLTKQLLEHSQPGTTKVLNSEWTQEALSVADTMQTFFVSGFSIDLRSAASWGASKFDNSPEETASELAEMILSTQTAQSSNDLGPARRLKDRLQTELMDLSLKKATGGSDETDRLKNLEMTKTALQFVCQQLGDDEDSFVDVAPRFVGMRLCDARDLAEGQSIVLVESDIKADEDRTVMRASNWIVSSQETDPGEPLSKLRKVHVKIRKSSD